MSEDAKRFVGEGRLGWIDSLGGPRAVFPVVAALLVIAALAVLERFAPFSLALGALVPLWYAWRMRVPQNLVRAMRHGRPTFRVELDDLGVRTFDASAAPTSALEWFELGSYYVADHGVVLLMRVAKGGVNAVLVPKAFFTAAEWPVLIELVRAKLPGAARAMDEASERAREAQKAGRTRTIVLGLVLLLLGLSVLWVVRDRL